MLYDIVPLQQINHALFFFLLDCVYEILVGGGGVGGGEF